LCAPACESRAKLPLTLGHEIAGVVVECGAGIQSLKKGDRVASTYRIACGHCRYCRGGHGEICDNRRGIGEHRDGGYAEYVTLPESVLAKIPDGVTFEQACVCGCVIGAVYNAVVRSASVRPGETVLVTGAGGGVGAHAVQTAPPAGARGSRLRLLKQTGAIEAPEPTRSCSWPRGDLPQVKQLTAAGR
jgi:acryloyl-coenzyme A reductase